MAQSAAMTLLRRRSGGPAALAVVLLVAGCGGPGPTGSPSPATPTASQLPSASVPATASPSATPLPSGANDALYSRIEQQVIALRGLQLEQPVEREVLDEAGLRDYITSNFNQDNPASFVTATEHLYKTLLLMPQDASLENLYVELLTSQVAGLYDDKTKKMYVVSRSGAIGPAEEVTYAHEFTHALQDQHFGLRKLVGDAKDQGDRTLARTALVEGDATLLMSLWAQAHLTAAELAEVVNAADPASQAVLDKMPAILREPLLFPYTSGLTLTLGDFGRGGFGAVDQQFGDPPDTTEQVLHPDKLAAREPAVAVSLPADLAARMGSGWTVALEDTLGEFQLEILLRDVGGASAAVSTAAAAGWGGDRIALLEGPSGGTGVVLSTAWDTANDADEYLSAAAGLVAKLTAAGRSASLLTPEPGRIVLLVADSDRTLGRLANVLGLAG
jgi:hypothetical protein